MKRFLSVFLTVIMVTVSAASAFAENTPACSTNNFEFSTIARFSNSQEILDSVATTEKEQAYMENEISILESFGLGEFELSGVEKCDEDNVYLLRFENYLDRVSVEVYEDGSVQLNCEEGEKKDVILKTARGELFHNGVKVFENSPSGAKGFTFSTTTACPYGNSSDYSYSAGATNKPNMALGNFLKNMTVAAVVAILFTAITGGGSLAALGYAALSSIATGMIQYAVLYDPYQTALSCKINTYYHKSTKSYSINNTLKVKKQIIKWYIGKNYKTYRNTITLFTYGVWG